MNRAYAPLWSLFAAIAAAAGVACAPSASAPPTPRLQVADVLGGEAQPGFERAIAGREFTFPADHGPHLGFRTEWWYFTGNLQADDGRRFGYQLTIFRTALAPPTLQIQRSSAWAARDLYMAHFALTDVAGERFYAFDRFNRGALGLAGAQARPWRVWLDDWSLEQVGDEPFPLRLRAHHRTGPGGDSGDDVAIDLLVEPTKPLILQGDRGLSRKGSSPGNASYYYSFTRLRTAGSIRVGDGTYQVDGDSWLDREWSTSALESNQVGWDWFALQLDDDTELIFYQLRQSDGGPSPHSAGVLVAPNGATVSLAAGDVELTVVRTWNSPIDDTEYPAAWTISIPAHGLSLQVEPYLRQQELDLTFRYWEGAVQVRGTVDPTAGQRGATNNDGPRSLTGSGYVELTGYALRTRPDGPRPTASR